MVNTGYSKNLFGGKEDFPPVVSVVGHIDHGKSSLLDAIRKTNLTAEEHGGITQRIGAYKVEVVYEGKKRRITFIDTPGHEAFANMRSQGVSASDIVLLVVAADDGVMPQTRESIKKIQEANIPFIVVFTKIDLENSNVEKVKKQILLEGILLEGLGGDVPYIGVSSKTGQGIKELLDLILLVYDLSGIKKDRNKDFLGIVLESGLDKRRGPVATMIVKSGELRISDPLFYQDTPIGKVRALFSSTGKPIKLVAPGDPAEILGIKQILAPGSLLSKTPILPTITQKKEIFLQKPALPLDVSSLFKEKEKTVNIILKTETRGELDAILSALPEGFEVVASGQGDVSVADVILAQNSKALIVGFNVKISQEAENLAKTEKVFYKTYNIIYKLFEELYEVKEALFAEKKTGVGQIVTGFKTKDGRVLGIKVTEGKLCLGDRVELKRGEKRLGKAKIVSLKHEKQDIKEAKEGLECGAIISPSLDFLPGDAIISYSR